jgi:hypothetical protein
MRVLVCALALLAATASASAQSLTQNLVLPPVTPQIVNLSGPRVGLTVLSPGVVDKLGERVANPPSTISQFGWQFEKAFYTTSGGVAAVNEWVGLLGGLERNLAIPSLSWLVGMRTTSGAEFGIGPNVSPSGAALVLAAGVTLRSGFLNVPLNVAVVPSKHGSRVSFLTGFNMRGR